jgi:hypothetical protein
VGATSNVFVADIRYPTSILRSPVSDKNLSDSEHLVRYRINPIIKRFNPISDIPLSDFENVELYIYHYKKFIMRKFFNLSQCSFKKNTSNEILQNEFLFF